MKTLKKYAYQSPETEILSLETKRVLLEGSDTINPEEIVEGDVTGGFGAPWRY